MLNVMLLAAMLSATAPPAVELRLLVTGKSDFGPRLRILLINEGESPVSLVLPGDGSAHGWRTPILEWIIHRDDGAEVASLPTARCGNMNPLMLADIFQINPGDFKKIDDLWITTPPREPGRYRLALRYRNDPTLEWRTPQRDQEALRRVRASTPVDLVSNEIVIEIPPIPARQERK